MSEVTQTITASEERVAQGVYGNCMQAAVASLLDKPLDAVPHFGAFTWWPSAMTLWLRGEGLDMTQIDAPPIPQERALLVGRSPRDNAHMVVSEGGRIVWDPHPSRGGLVTVTGAILVHPWETNPDVPELNQRAHERQAALDDPLGVARQVLAAMSPSSPDGRDVPMGLHGIGLALVDIADSLRKLTNQPQPAASDAAVAAGMEE